MAHSVEEEIKGGSNWGDIFYIGMLLNAAEAGHRGARDELIKMGYREGIDFEYIPNDSDRDIR